MKKIVIGILLTLSLQAGDMLIDGSKAWEQINDGNKNYNSLHLGYYMGIISGVKASLNGMKICIPKDVNNNQLAAIIRKYIKNNPEKWNDGIWMVFDSLTQTFPCSNKK
jgi:hypothetical protein